MTARHWLGLAIVAALWGASYLFMKVALDDDVSEQFILSSRMLLGAAVLVPLALRAGGWERVRSRPGWMLALATLQVIVPFALIVWGENWIATGLAGVLIAAAPLFLAAIAPFIAPDESSRGLALVGVVIGLAGVALLMAGDIGGLGSKAVLGGVMMLGAALAYAFAPIIVRQRFSDVPPVTVAAATMLISGLVWLPFALAALPAHGIETKTWLSLIVLGAGGTGIAFLIYYSLIGEVGAARASIVAYLAPVFSVSYGTWLLDEPLTITMLSGMALILGGSYLAGKSGEEEPGLPVEAPAPTSEPTR